MVWSKSNIHFELKKSRSSFILNFPTLTLHASEPLESTSTLFKAEQKRERERERKQTMATNIGMMDSAYFVGRSEILAWINSTLQLNLSKVEEVRFPLRFKP